MGNKYNSPEGPDFEELLALTQVEYENQSELVDTITSWVNDMIDQQGEDTGAVIDQMLITMGSESDFAAGMREVFTELGLPQMDRAAQALRDVGRWTEGEQAARARARTAATGDVRSQAERDYFNQLQNYSATGAEQDYLRSLRKYQESPYINQLTGQLAGFQGPAELQRFIDEAGNYQTPGAAMSVYQQMAGYQDPAELGAHILELQNYSDPQEMSDYISALTGYTDPEEIARVADELSSYTDPQEVADYIAALKGFESPEELLNTAQNMATYQDPQAVDDAISALQGWDSTARIREAEGAAAVDVATSGEAARRAAEQRLESYGIDPSQVAGGAIDREMRARTAAEAALASSQARREIQYQGLNADVQAANMAAESDQREFATQLAGGRELLDDRIRQLEMMGMASDEAVASALRELDLNQQGAQMTMESRVRELTMQGMGADAAVAQAQRELAAHGQAANLATESARAEMGLQGQGADALVRSRAAELEMLGYSADAAMQLAMQQMSYLGLAAATDTESRLRQLDVAGMAAAESDRQRDEALYAQGDAAAMQRDYRAYQDSMAGIFAGIDENHLSRKTTGEVNAYNIYAGGPQMTAGSYSTAATAGGNASQSSVASTGTGVNAMGMVGQLGTTPMGTLGTGWGTANSIYGNNIASAANQAQSGGGFGSAVGNLFGTVLGGWASGGFISPFAEGGHVDPSMSPSGGVIPDDVPAAVSANEYVIPADVVRYYGLARLDSMVEKARRSKGAIPTGD